MIQCWNWCYLVSEETGPTAYNESFAVAASSTQTQSQPHYPIMFLNSRSCSPAGEIYIYIVCYKTGG